MMFVQQLHLDFVCLYCSIIISPAQICQAYLLPIYFRHTSNSKPYLLGILVTTAQICQAHFYLISGILVTPAHIFQASYYLHYMAPFWHYFSAAAP